MSNENPEGADAFEEWLESIQRRGKQIFTQLAHHNIRIFRLSLRSKGGKYDDYYWIHDEKTSEEWRQDIRSALDNNEKQNEDGYADGDLFNGLFNHLRQLGYSQIDSVLADVFEGRISNCHAKLEHCPRDEDQPDGFGHGGWDSHRQPK